MSANRIHDTSSGLGSKSLIQPRHIGWAFLILASIAMGISIIQVNLVILIGRAQQRFSEGGRCFGAYSDGMLVAATWLLRQPEPARCRALKVTLSENELLAVDSYTSPILRGRGIQTALKQWGYAKTHAEGLTIKALVPRDNKAISAVWRKLGATRIDKRTQWFVLGQSIE